MLKIRLECDSDCIQYDNGWLAVLPNGIIPLEDNELFAFNITGSHSIIKDRITIITEEIEIDWSLYM